jgi:hypothetical protein
MSRRVNCLIISSEQTIIDVFIEQMEHVINQLEFNSPYFYDFHFIPCVQNNTLEQKILKDDIHLIFILIQNTDIQLWLPGIRSYFSDHIILSLILDKSIERINQNFVNETFVYQSKSFYKSIYKKSIQYCTNIIFPTLEIPSNQETSLILYQQPIIEKIKINDETQLDRIERKLDLLLRLAGQSTK